MARSMTMFLALTALLLVTANAGDSPMAKVVKLIQDLQKDIVSKGTAMAKEYSEFADYCKKTNKKLSESITTANNKIEVLSGDIGEAAASQAEKEGEVTKRKANQEEMAADMTDTVNRCSTASATYAADAADSDKALQSLNRAIEAMNKRKGQIGKGSASLLQYTLNMATSMHLVAPAQHKAVTSFLQGNVNLDPSDPAFKYHSLEINKMLAKLLAGLKDDKKSLDDKWSTTKDACSSEKTALAKKMQDNMNAMTAAEEKIEGLKKTGSELKGELVNTADQLSGDKNLLQTTTARCEEKATEFDRRANLQNGVVTAIKNVLAVLTNDKSGSADKAVYGQTAEPELNLLKKKPAKVSKKLAISFLQVAPAKAVTSFLAKRSTSDLEHAAVQQVISLLKNEGERLGSPEMSTLAMRVAQDHFKKVKQLIQGLIERLLDEKHAETSKNSFCVTEVAKAEKNRDHADQKAQGLGADLAGLESKKEELEAELKELAKGIESTTEDLAEATSLRKDEKKTNEEQLATVNAGIGALNEARAYFLKAAKLQDKVAAPKAWKASTAEQSIGKGGHAIVALLDTISADFAKEVSETEHNEADAAAEFVKYDRMCKEDISSKETKTKLDNQDLKSTHDDIERTMADLKTQTGLVDNALKMIENLKPVCLDAGGMNFKERTNKRDEEVAALKKSIEVLSEDTTGKK